MVSIKCTSCNLVVDKAEGFFLEENINKFKTHAKAKGHKDFIGVTEDGTTIYEIRVKV